MIVRLLFKWYWRQGEKIFYDGVWNGYQVTEQCGEKEEEYLYDLILGLHYEKYLKRGMDELGLFSLDEKTYQVISGEKTALVKKSFITEKKTIDLELLTLLKKSVEN